MTATDARDTAHAQLRAAMAVGDDLGAIRLRRVLRDLDSGDRVPVDGWLPLPDLDRGPDRSPPSPVCIAVRDR